MPLNDVPLAGQTLNATQNPIRQNFITINTAFGTDHVNYTAGGQGKHNKITFPVQNPAPTPTGGDVVMYSLLDATTNSNELYVRKTAGGGIPFTASILSTDPALGFFEDGWAYLPCGLLMKWGTSGYFSANPTAIVFPVGVTIPAFTQIFNITMAQYDSSGSPKDNPFWIQDGTMTTLGFSIYARGGTSGTAYVSYFAIGR